MNRTLGTSIVDPAIFDGIFSNEFGNKSIIVNDFLDKYHSLFDKFMKTCLISHQTRSDFLLTISRFHDLKNLVEEAGGLRCLNIMNEYEKYLCIRDQASCSKIEIRMLDELDIFKETFVSMIA